MIMRYSSEKFDRNRKTTVVYTQSIFDDRLLLGRGEILLTSGLVASCGLATGVTPYR